MNFGQNLYQWFLSNAQSLVLMAIVVIGIYLGFKREFSKLIGFLGRRWKTYPGSSAPGYGRNRARWQRI